MSPPVQGQKEHINLANNQVSHNTKIKSGKENRQSEPPTTLSKTELNSTKYSNWKKKEWKPLSSKE
jgi:hypothetical protein